MIAGNARDGVALHLSRLRPPSVGAVFLCAGRLLRPRAAVYIAPMDKEFILSEIKRTTAANGGKAHGSRRFATETGIKQSDWFGVHWARWGDALREAGFAANELNSGYDAAELLGNYADLALELGRLPSGGDLRLKARGNCRFPSHNAFGRLGTKAEFVRQLGDYCRANAGYEAVLAWCDEYVAGSKLSADDAGPEPVFGVVYLLKSGRFYKVGRSNAAGRREYELAIQLPEKAKMIHAITTDDPCGIEAYWHKRFDAKRQNGEWFALDSADLKAFKRRKFM
jgi:Meiotically up-regulated gene 113